MRTKHFLITLCVLITVSLSFIVFGQHKPDSIHSLVTSTNEQLQSFKDNLLRDAEVEPLKADQRLLDLLGFTIDAKLFNSSSSSTSTNQFVVVTHVREGEESQGVGFVMNIARVLPHSVILVYNVGLDDYGLRTLQTYCNSTKCQIITLDFEPFPSHVLDEPLHAYRPIIIQDALSRTGSILFIESNHRFLSNVTNQHVMHTYRVVRGRGGAGAWPMRKSMNPVTSLTHKKMFEYFRADAENFQFLQMVNADVLLLINTGEVHQQVMLPWVQCALTQDCICPIGAQSTGCRFDKKPSYRYSGCHLFDVSALNIVLGLRYTFKSDRYTLNNVPEWFEVIPLRRADAQLRLMEQNSTTDNYVQQQQ